MKRLGFAFLLFQLMLSHAQAAHMAEGIVQYCVDGDTCHVQITTRREALKVRLVGIDAPELSHQGRDEQPHARDSKRIINQLIQHKSIALKIFRKDQYGRALGEIYLDNTNINLQLVTLGAAEVYEGKNERGIDLSAYARAQSQAQKNKLGIWRTGKFESPFRFRHTVRDSP